MAIYFNKKNGNFEELKRTTVDYKILLTQELLDAGVKSDWINGSEDHVYTSEVSGVEFSFVKCDEILLPEYSSGAYRVSSGTYWDPSREEYIYD